MLNEIKLNLSDLKIDSRNNKIFVVTILKFISKKEEFKKYMTMLKNNNYIYVEDILNDKDVIDWKKMGILKLGHRKKIIKLCEILFEFYQNEMY
jgi:hypothetical protein